MFQVVIDATPGILLTSPPKIDIGPQKSEMAPLKIHKAHRYHVQTLDRALNILECFSFQNKELNLSAIVKQTGLNKTTAKRLIANLTARGYLQQDADTKRYQHGMLGMILMANLGPREIKRILKKYPLLAYTASSIVHKSQLNDRLAKIRKNGHIVEWEETVEGLVGIAAPIHDYSRRVIAALGIALPIGRFKPAQADKSIANTIKSVKNTCNLISKDLGFSGA
jgi:DNA-binding IclR family transcriptional regulator